MYLFLCVCVCVCVRACACMLNILRSADCNSEGGETGLKNSDIKT